MNAKDDSYQTPAFFYNMEMDQLVVANTITNKMDAEDIPSSDDEEESEVQKQNTWKIPRWIQKKNMKPLNWQHQGHKWVPTM